MSRRGTAAVEEAPSFTIEEQRAMTQKQMGVGPGGAPGRPQDHLFRQREASMRRRLANTPNHPATVVNFLPCTLMVNSCLPELTIRIPGCELKDEFTTHTWHEPIIEVVMAGGVRTPNDYVPRQIAEEYVREYSTEDAPGGVMLFDGTREQFLEAMETDPNVREVVAQTKAQAITYMQRRANEAEAAWNTPNHQLSANITDLHRKCAARLEKLGAMGAKPQWMDIVRSQQSIIEPCPNCKAEPKPGSATCTGCGYVINPEVALKNGVIDEYHISLERLTRDQVKALDISDYVAETIDEVAARRKAGMPKPMSLVMQRQQAQMSELTGPTN